MPKIRLGPKVSLQFDRQIDRLSTPPAGGGGGTIQHPFQILDVSVTGDTPAAKITVRYGTLMDVEPDNVATDLDVADGSNYIYLHVTVDLNGTMTAVELVVDSSPQPANGDYDGYITLGNVTAADDAVTAINQACTHSLRFAMCGRVVEGESLTTAGAFEFWGF